MHTDATPRTGVRTVTVPDRPAPKGLSAEKVYDVLLWVLGLVGATVSGWSIATMLHDDGGMQWGFAVLGVGVYDLLAFMSGLMVYIRRAEPHRAVGAQAIMLLAIGGSAYVNYMHGRQIGGDLVALVLGAAPVVFEVAFAMRHNVMSVVCSILYPGAVWRRYKDGAWIKLHTGSLPVPSALVPEASGSPSGDLPEASVEVPEPAEVLPEATEKAQVSVVPEASGSLTEWARKQSVEPEAVAEVLPLHFRNLPEGTEARAEAVAEALRKGERITGETVASMYGVSDRTGRTYIRRAKEINAAREDA